MNYNYRRVCFDPTFRTLNCQTTKNGHLGIWGFEIGELLAAALRYRYLKVRPFCIKIIL
ncbi:hypothetical protein IQ231_08035 [Cuspidothrix issatschenkoi LEGE 03284]|uniref:hypothetical protein n=1 Tax=Cuspidothrix issatschenkoi TaxID=230752 RepID=UPI001A0588AE|nr:hypothetical protein [Cuspidothrix issatschenkoi]MBE9231638.1 hypothetical protein [Cuspidothrix issatschenkoi LEGE 03284]